MLYTVLWLSNVTEKNKLFTFKALLFVSTKFDDLVRRKIKGSWQVHVYELCMLRAYPCMQTNYAERDLIKTVNSPLYSLTADLL